MQKIIHTDYKNVHPIMDELERFYMQTSVRADNSLLPLQVDNSFLSLIDIFNQYSGTNYNIQLVDKKYERLSLPNYDKKNIIVCFSGGKDSTAIAIHYKKCGYNVYLYHVTGLNKTYYNEHECAEEIAKELDLPLHTEDVSYSGNHEWIEHPLKNAVLANLALSYGIREDIGVKIAVGNFYTSSLRNDAFDVCAGDDIEMWKAYESIISTIIQGFRVYIANKNYQTAYNTLSQNPALMQKTISCLTPNRFRTLFRNRTQNKYAVELWPNRCGCCWKCAVEYIWCADHNLQEYNSAYYYHCLEVLANTATKETGLKYHPETVWDEYFFYRKPKKH